MIRDGWIDEVQQFVASDMPPDAKPFQFIGYSELRRISNAGRVTKEKKKALSRRFSKLRADSRSDNLRGSAKSRTFTGSQALGR